MHATSLQVSPSLQCARHVQQERPLEYQVPLNASAVAPAPSALVPPLIALHVNWVSDLNRQPAITCFQTNFRVLALLAASRSRSVAIMTFIQSTAPVQQPPIEQSSRFDVFCLTSVKQKRQHRW